MHLEILQFSTLFSRGKQRKQFVFFLDGMRDDRAVSHVPVTLAGPRRAACAVDRREPAARRPANRFSAISIQIRNTAAWE